MKIITILQVKEKVDDSISEQICNVLKHSHATSKDLSEELDIGEGIIGVVLNRMAKTGVIKHTGRFINRYKVYRLVRPEELELGINCEKFRELLVKMILPFAKSGIKVSLTSEESEIIQKLFEKSYTESGERIDG